MYDLGMIWEGFGQVLECFGDLLAMFWGCFGDVLDGFPGFMGVKSQIVPENGCFLIVLSHYFPDNSFFKLEPSVLESECLEKHVPSATAMTICTERSFTVALIFSSAHFQLCSKMLKNIIKSQGFR